MLGYSVICNNGFIYYFKDESRYLRTYVTQPGGCTPYRGVYVRQDRVFSLAELRAREQ